MPSVSRRYSLNASQKVLVPGKPGCDVCKYFLVLPIKNQILCRRFFLVAVRSNSALFDQSSASQ